MAEVRKKRKLDDKLQEELAKAEKIEAELEEANHRRSHEPRRECPYLSTVSRQLLDFDFEKVCSVTLVNFNVYACLVCGRYFQGRGVKSPAYTHSLQDDHHVFINLHTCKVPYSPSNLCGSCGIT